MEENYVRLNGCTVRFGKYKNTDDEILQIGNQNVSTNCQIVEELWWVMVIIYIISCITILRTNVHLHKLCFNLYIPTHEQKRRHSVVVYFLSNSHVPFRLI